METQKHTDQDHPNQNRLSKGGVDQKLVESLISSKLDESSKDFISLDQLSELSGISKKHILKELFLSGAEKSDSDDQDKVSMSDLRDAMIKYLDKTML